MDDRRGLVVGQAIATPGIRDCGGASKWHLAFLSSPIVSLAAAGSGATNSTKSLSVQMHAPRLMDSPEPSLVLDREASA